VDTNGQNTSSKIESKQNKVSFSSCLEHDMKWPEKPIHRVMKLSVSYTYRSEAPWTHYSGSYNGLPLPEQDKIKEYSNDYSNLHNETQIQANTCKQNMGFWSTKRTMKDNHEQAVPYPSFGKIFHNLPFKGV
jgi:hypothetical protein